MIYLPTEIIHYIFEYLPPKELSYVGATCKRFYKIAQSEDLPARLKILMIPKLNSRTIQENALMLWNYPEGNFSVDNENRLVQLSSYHVIARFFKWNDSKNVTAKVSRIVEITFQEIYRLNQQGFLTEKATDKIFTPRRLYVWDPKEFYSFYYPADYLADRILHSKQFANENIHKAAQLIKRQANMYEKNAKNYGLSNMSIITEFCEAPFKDERVLWDDCDIDEAFFSKDFK